MVTPEDIQARRRAEPFVPFVLVLTDGRKYTVRDPELMRVGTTWVMVGAPSADAPGVSDHITRLALADVAELLPLAAEAGSNSRSGRPTRELELVALVADLPWAGLAAGEVGTVVGVWADGVYEVEFVDAAGRTYGLHTLRAAQVVRLHNRGQAFGLDPEVR